jgi:hypothetical protein
VALEAAMRALDYIGATAALVFFLSMGYGVCRLTYAPIQERNGQYADKLGNVTSRAEYEHLKALDKVLLGSWAVTMAWGAAEYMRNRRRVRR